MGSTGSPAAFPDSTLIGCTIAQRDRRAASSHRYLVETIPTERFFNPTLGTDIRQSLFELVSYNTATIIRDQIVNTVGFYEDRIENLKVKVDPQPDDNSFDVTIFFDIVGQDFPPQSFSFILEATR